MFANISRWKTKLRPTLVDASRLLMFRLSPAGFLKFDREHLILGLIMTWIVGIGRWWDDPGANILQHLGIGSVVYVFLLAAILWLIIRPLNPANWSYSHVLTFVALTSPPALLYAIPVERFTDLATARSLNVWFLATVALWRVALLFFYLRRHARLKYVALFVASLLPLSAIVTTLTILNLEKAAFNIMGGLRDAVTSNDSAYGILFGLTFLSMILIIPVFVIYIFLIAFGGRAKDPSILGDSD